MVTNRLIINGAQPINKILIFPKDKKPFGFESQRFVQTKLIKESTIRLLVL